MDKKCHIWETEELCSINICPLVTAPFAVQWSPDNQISLITEGGVHVLELQPSPMSPNPTVKFTRSFVNPSDTLPAYAFATEMESLVWKLERQEIYSLLMEEAITPKLNGVSDIAFRIIKIAWSPKNLISPNQCILAILTTSGAVELLHKVSNEWYSICDISILRLNIVQEEIKSSLRNCMNSFDTMNQYATTIHSMRKLQACSITWSELFEMGKTYFAYFAVAYRNGDISIWKIPRISNFTASLKPVLAIRIELKITLRINLLCWVSISANEHLLIVGYIDGRIYSIKLSCDIDKLQIDSIEKCTESDRIGINHFHIVHKDKSHIKILAAKGIFLLLLCINWTGSLKSIKYLRTKEFNITGINSITAQKFLISTQDAHVFVVDIQSDELVLTNITTHLPQTRVQYLGLAHSPNKVMFVNITSPSMSFDHLVVKEPSTIHVFALKSVDPLPIVNNSTSLTNIWDCMEMLRVKAAKAEDPSTVLCTTTTTEKPESLHNLRVSMWMTVMMNVCKVKKPIPNIDHIRQSKISRELPLIYVHFACAYLDNLTKKGSRKRKSILSNDQKIAIGLLRKYLNIYLTNEDNDDEEDERDEKARRCARETLKATASCITMMEKCNLCCETINELSRDVTSCPSGHKLPRCAITLLQITSLEYRVCRICGQMFHSCLEQVSQEPCCQFCDVPLLYNEYALDVEGSELYGKNLSQLRVNIVESSKEQQYPEESHEKPHKNKRTAKAKTASNCDDNSDDVQVRWGDI